MTLTEKILAAVKLREPSSHAMQDACVRNAYSGADDENRRLRPLLTALAEVACAAERQRANIKSANLETMEERIRFAHELDAADDALDNALDALKREVGDA